MSKSSKSTLTNEQSFTTTLLFDQTPQEVFDAIVDVRGWWSADIDGRTDVLGAEFKYRYNKLHDTTQKITELVPGKKVAWRVVASYLDFVKDHDEWTGTDVLFEIAKTTTKNGDKTELRFTHVGLVPSVECYAMCSGGWTFYVTESLKKRITTGTGEPDARRDRRSFSTSIVVDASPQEVFDAVNDVRGWWTGDVEGRTDAIGAEFTYRYKDIHRTTQKITELVPGKKIVWHVTASHLAKFADKSEWDGTDVVFEIAKKKTQKNGDATELRFTHVGLVPTIECYGDCSGAWGFLVEQNLRKRIESARVQPKAMER